MSSHLQYSMRHQRHKAYSLGYGPSGCFTAELKLGELSDLILSIILLVLVAG